MNIRVLDSSDALGKEAAILAADILNKAIEEQGRARIVLSTGASQFDFFKHFVDQKIDWAKLEVFHLDEYVGLPESHPASFRKYIQERFLDKVSVEKAYLINGEGDPAEEMNRLKSLLDETPVDLGMIGIGENAHIAFNDPPADFQIQDPFRVVELDDACKNQQVGEGWFASLQDVPTQAISMTVSQIMRCKTIISCVPYAVKETAVKNTVHGEVSPMVPATILKTHPQWHLLLDEESAVGLGRK